MRILKLSLLSALILYFELLFIRLIGVEIRIFSYIPNLLLLVIFISTSAGMFIRRSVPLIVSSIGIFVVVGIVSSGIFSSITSLLAPLEGGVIWFAPTNQNAIGIAVGFLQLLLLFSFIVAIFLPLGQLLGTYMNEQKDSLYLYTVNIIFSLVGSLLYFALSAFGISPYIGILLGSLAFLFLFPKKWKMVHGIFISVFVVFLFLNRNNGDVWSPYQKLTLTTDTYSSIMPPQKTLLVNNVGFMSLLDLSKEKTKIYREILKDNQEISLHDIAFQNLYDIPYILRASMQDVLLLGAGAGNDAAAALRADIPRIDAVEIDPKVIAFGKKYHPEKPYLDNRVNIHIEDARAFVQNTKKKYDLIVLGFLDSHTTNSSFTNVQLDNYLYTIESMKQIEKALKPDGILYVSFGVYRPWVGSRIQESMTHAFGYSPLIYTVEDSYSGGGTYFLIAKSKQSLDRLVKGNEDFSQFIQTHTRTFARGDIITDDWPYLYLQSRKIPTIHILVGILISIIFFSFMEKIGTTRNINNPSLFLGAAFLLFEFQNISRLSLIFGNTWVTSVYGICGILLCCLIAVVVFKIFFSGQTFPRHYIYVFLFISLIIEVLISPEWLRSVSPVARVFASSIFLSLPVIFAELIFIDELKRNQDKRSFYASNYLGSFVGGILSYVSYVTGINSILYVVMILYACSLFWERETMVSRS